MNTTTTSRNQLEPSVVPTRNVSISPHVGGSVLGGAATPSASPAAPASTASASGAVDAAASEEARESERLAMRGDPLAVTLYRFLQSRPEADARHVLDALAARRGALEAASTATTKVAAVQGGRPSTEGERVALCRMSLSAAAADLRRFPSRREYDRWRDSQPHRQELASASLIRRTFRDSWTEAIGQLGAPTADFAARRLLMGGKSFTARERERALRLFLEAVPAGQRTRAAYRDWARQYIQQPGAFDVPLSAGTLTSCSGLSWSELLAAAGAPEERYRAFTARNGVRKCGFLTPEQILDRIRRAAQELGVPAPTSLEYNRWAADARDENGRPIAPKSMTIMKHFGGWSIALFKAGLIDEQQLAMYWHRRELRMSDDRLLQFLAAALRDLGPNIGRLQYRKWRWRVIRHPDWAGARIPSDVCIWERFGNDWGVALGRAKDVKPAPEVPNYLHPTSLAVWTKQGSRMERGRR